MLWCTFFPLLSACVSSGGKKKKKINDKKKKKKGKKIKSPVYLTSRFTLVYASCRNV